jgi:pimeloyl-ACP methyl ester carboxylesterase
MPRFEARGIELAWEEEGEPGAAATVFVHETGTAGSVWDPVTKRLAAEGSRAVVYDRRGWGDSGKPENYVRTTVEEQSEDLAELIAVAAPVGLVCGAGLGGLIALDLLLRHPGAAECAVLVEPLIPGLVPAATEALSEDREALREAVQRRGATAMVELYLEGGLEALGPGIGRLPSELTGAARAQPGSLAAELGAASSWTYPLRGLAEATTMVGIVTCADTPALLLESADALAERLPGATRIEIAEPGPPHVGAADRLAGIVSSAVPR